MAQDQEHVTRVTSVQDEDAEAITASAAATTVSDIDEIDAVLDDIESILETNAETYIDSFVQKGGQ